MLRLYPADFRDDMGEAIVDAYRQRLAAAAASGAPAIMALWMRALVDALWNGPAERLRPAALWRRGGQWGRDLELARRRLRRAPLFVAAPVGTLTTGLGAFAVVYTAVDKVLIEPLPYRASQDLYWVWRDHSSAAGLPRDAVSGPDIAELQGSGGVIEAAAGMQLFGPTLSATRDGEPLQISLMTLSPNLFDLLGAAPALGRSFTTQEVGPSRPPIVVLSHALWERLGANPALVGGQVWMSGSPYTVIGVMAPDFRFVRDNPIGPPQGADVYTPFGFHVADRDPDGATYAALIRARRGATGEQVKAAVEAAGRAALARTHHNRTFRLYPVGMHAALVARVSPVLLTLGFAGAFLVVVLCVNLASLLLARTASRERELAVSRAVGANTIAVVRATLLEGAVLGLLGGIAGALIGRWGTRLLVTLAPADLPRREAIDLDWGIALVVILVGVTLGVAAAALPAAWASRVSLASVITSGRAGGIGSVTPMRRVLIVGQIAMSLVLLSAGGLVVRSFERLLATEPGFRTDGVLTFTVAMGPRLFPKPEGAMLFQDRLEAALRSQSGIVDVSATTALPLSAPALQSTIALPGAPGNTGDREHDAPIVDVIDVRARYPEVMGMNVIAGRSFDPARRDGVREALVDASLARQFFPNGSPLGATVTLNGVALTVVGVVKQARLYDLHQDGRPQLYTRAEDRTPYAPFFAVRTSGDPRGLITTVSRVVRQVDPRIPVSAMRALDEIVEDALRQPRISAVLIAAFAIGALLLVTMGLFGMVSGAVTRRHGELAVRLALGATHNAVLRLVVGEGALLIAIGMLVAIPGVYWGGAAMRALLVGVSPFDPVTLLSVAAGLASITLLACYVPARRVLHIDPAPLLRSE
jgi:predicted permease